MKWIIWGLAFLIGLLVGWFLPVVPGLQFASQVDVGNFLNALATLIVAVVIGYLYANQASAKRADTDLLLDTLGETKAAVGALQQAALPCHSGKKLSLQQQTALTDTPFPGPYDDPSRTRILSRFKSIRDELVRLSFAISRR